MAPVELTENHQPAPGCYRHPDRKTYVSCGRCGKPLCPDCMRFGPVGIRCDECLRPSSHAITVPTMPIEIKSVRSQAIIFAVLGFLLIIVASIVSSEMIARQFLSVLTLPPNPLLSGIAGGLVGWRIWHNSGKVYNWQTIRLSLILGIAIPLAAALVITIYAVVIHGSLAHLNLAFALRVLFPTAISTFFCWFLATQQHN
ncbi:MAG: hypothetical protein WCJ56_15060 [bacterium]